VSVDAIVLAGGAATRFGGDKLAALIDGDTVLARALVPARQVADRIVVVLGPSDADPALAGVVVARDPVAHRGPLAGLVTGLEALPDAGTVVVLAGDMPTVHANVLALMVEAIDGGPTADAAYLEADPVATLPMTVRAANVLPAAQALLAADRRSLRALLDAVRSVEIAAARWRALDASGETLRDIDVPADLGLGRPT
jgi:molybdopterin-guanine dinucleotide biosynthesis protein A